MDLSMTCQQNNPDIIIVGSANSTEDVKSQVRVVECITD